MMMRPRMGTLAVLCACSVLGACKRPDGTKTSSAPAAQRSARAHATRPSRKAAASLPAAAHAKRLESAVGHETLATLRAPGRMWCARLRREAVRQAEHTALRNDKRFAGYPLATSPQPVPRPTAERLGRLLSADGSYAFDVARRCANRRWVGVRAERGKARVEVALGSPCDQIVFAWKVAGRTRRWGAVVRPGSASTFRQVLKGVSDRCGGANPPREP